MIYRTQLLQAIAENDRTRIEAIHRLNNPGSYIGSIHDRSHDKLVAGTSQLFRRTHQGFYPNERY